MSFTAGSTRFDLTPLDKGNRPYLTRRSQVATAACIAFLGMAMLVIFASPAETSPTALATLDAANKPVVHEVPAVAEVSKILFSRMRAAGLVGLFSEAASDGTVTVSGGLLANQQPVWAKVKQWFDSTYGMTVVLVDRVGLSNVAAPLTVSAVRSDGKTPFVIDQSGQKLFIGSPLPGGWVIDGIEQTRVLVKRNGDILAVSF